MAATGIDGVWEVLDARVAAGLVPGYAAAVRLGGETHVRAGGRLSLEPDSAQMGDDSLFRIASLTKPIAAALTLSLVQDGVVALDDPIARWLPEAAEPRVLVAPDASLDDTVAAERTITIRHLLDMTCGWGVVFDPTPLQAAMFERQVFPGAVPPPITGDEYVERLCSLPLRFQPGAGWAYDSGMDLLAVLLTRATGSPLGDLLAARITGPLGMPSTAFGAVDRDRLTTAYAPGDGGDLRVTDPVDGYYGGPPPFERLSGGLVADVCDVLRFSAAMADGGAPVLTTASVAQMTANALTDAQRRSGAPIIDEGMSWGLATGVDIAVTQPYQSVGRWGWTGGTGTTAHVDPERGLVAVLLTQREMTGPLDGPEAFWLAAAAAADAR